MYDLFLWTVSQGVDHQDVLPYLIPRGCKAEVCKSLEMSSAEVVHHILSERGQVAGGCVAGEVGSQDGKLQQGEAKSLRALGRAHGPPTAQGATSGCKQGGDSDLVLSVMNATAGETARRLESARA